MRKVIAYSLFSLLALLLVTLAFFPRATFEKISYLRLSSLLKKEIGGCLEQGKVRFQAGTLNLSHAHILTSAFDAKIVQAGFSLKEKELVIDEMELQFKERGAFGFDQIISFLFHSSVKTEVKKCTLFFLDQVVTCRYSKGIAEFFFKNGEVLTLHCASGEQGEFSCQTTCNFHDVTEPLDFVTYFLDFPHHLTCTRGSAEGAIEFALKQNQPVIVKGFVNVQNLALRNESLEYECQIDSGKASYDFETSHLTLALSEGLITLTGKKREMWEGMWDLKIPKADIVLKDGKVIDSCIFASFCGMDGKMALDMRRKEVFLDLEFLGSCATLQKSCPERFREAFGQTFANDTFAFKARLLKTPAGIECKGDLTVSENRGLSHKLFFGLHLDPNFGEKPIGWFQAKKFPLEKFFSPFLFKQKNLHLSGSLDFEGTFDENLLSFFYQGSNFILDSPHFKMQCEQVMHLPHLFAAHKIDLKTWEHFGMLPLEGVTYEQKGQEFTLQNASMLTLFANGEIRIKDIRTHFEDLNFNGDVTLEKHEDNSLDLWIKTTQVDGDLASGAHFLKKCIPGFNFEIPFDGDVHLAQGGVALHFLFEALGKTKLIDAQIVGGVNAGYESPYFKLTNYHMQFDYDHQQNRLQFSHGNGLFQVTSSSHICYEISTPMIEFRDFPSPQFAVECVVNKEGKNLFHLSGRTEKKGGKRDIIIEGEKFKLKAIQDAGQFIIDQFYVGSLQGKAFIDIADSVFKVSSFEIHSHDLGVLNFTGEYDAKKGVFKAEVPRLTLDLHKLFFNTPLPAALKEWGALWHPKGKLFGELDLTFDFKGKSFLVQSVSTFTDLGVAGIEFGDGKDLTWQFSSKEGLLAQGLEINSPDDLGQYKLGKLHYDLANQKIKFDDFDFSLPKEKIPLLGALAMRLFPGKFPKDMIAWSAMLKGEEALEGRVSLELFPDKVWAYLTLKDGVYRIFDKDQHIRNFALTLTSQGVAFKADSHIGEIPCFFSLGSSGLAMEEGVFLLKEHESSQDGLTAHWAREEGNQIQLKKITGSSFGIKAELQEKQKNILTGLCSLNFASCSRLFPKMAYEKIEKLGMKEGYSLEGDFAYSLNEKNLAFIGKLIGTNFSFGGMQIGSLRGDLLYSDHLIELDNLAILDWGGKLELPKLKCAKENEKWFLQIPKITMEGVRLSRLKSAFLEESRRSKKSYFKHLCIESFEANNIEGVLGDNASFKGFGNLTFTNLNRKTFFSGLLFLPSELTARIGLDLSLLVPAQGQIRYQIGQGRINLLKFKNMYSEGKRSRFYLAEGHDPYIDFNGNLNLKVKMKQYNLLMKLAEFFVVTVRGNILKPSYSFSNQYASDSEFSDDE